MSVPQLFVDGKVVSIGQRIGKGGEGEVYALANDPTRAIKFYTVADGAAREPKISAIVRMGLAGKSSLIAFPLAIARDQAGNFKGFVMHLVRDHKPIFELYAPQARKQHFPAADYRFLARAAVNTARAVAAVHETGCVIGDINHSGILVSENAKVALIDADSFQLLDGSQRYLCRVGVPEYTPPELQGLSLSDVVRTPNHDAFGLAIAIFQLLTMGRHPFVGTYASGEITLPRAISEFKFAYSRERSVGMIPPPAVCTLGDFPVFISAAFEIAFGASGPTSRPSAAQWVALLGEFEQSLQKCRNNGLHYHSAAASACPWCRMEQKLGMMLFLPKDLLSSFSLPADFTEEKFDLHQFWARVESIRVPTRNEIVPTFPTLKFAPSAEAITAKQKSAPSHGVLPVGILIAIAIVSVAPTMWFVGLMAVGIALFLAKQTTDPSAAYRQRFLAVENEWSQALDQREQRANFAGLDDLKESLVENKVAYEALALEEAQRIKNYQNEREAIHLAKWLESFRIRNYKIVGVGPAKLAALASYGIETAADATPEKVLRVPGFGAINSKLLFEWRKKCAHGFVCNPNPTGVDQFELRKIKADVHQLRQTLRQKLTSEAKQFAQAVQACRNILAKTDPTLEVLHKRRGQIEADLIYLNIPLPPRPTRPAPPRKSSKTTWNTVKPATRTQKATVSPSVSTNPTCPQCSSRMVSRIARRGARAGKPFWGCSRYPGCRGTRPI